MNNKSICHFVFVLILTVASLQAVAAKEEQLALKSPDARLVLTLMLARAAGTQTAPRYSVHFRGRELLHESTLGLALEGRGDLLAGAVLTSSRRDNHDETYQVLTGKQNPVRNHYRELELTFKSPDGLQTQVFFRAFNDAVAFRYAIPAQTGLGDIAISDEKSIFRLVGNPRAFVLYRNSYTTPHEGLYDKVRLDTLRSDRLIDLPALFEFEDAMAVAITEANLQHYAGMYLKRLADTEGGGLVSDLSPLPQQKELKVKVSVPMVSPWRVILIGKQVGRLIESTTILSLNESSRIADTSWIKPGKTTWHWWNGTEGDPVGFEAKLDLRTMKYYVDFCARHGITYHALVSTSESDLHPWYTQKEKGFFPFPDTDVLKPRPEIEFDELARYAAAKGVGLRAWVHWKAIADRLDEVFATFERWGLRGLMVDFLDRDDQEMVEFSERVLEKAAEHHLHIQFHGAWKPTGRQRAYPNLFNHEGVLNLEYLKWSADCTPEHNLIVPFTRMLAGPMDYHLGGFRAVRRNDFKPRAIAPVVMGTRSHHLAMYVVYENPMPMIVDYPSAYENQPGFDFIEQVPAVWDETRVLSAEIGEYIVSARRHGNEWYVGAMTNWTPRELDVPLDFLGRGSFQVETWSDGPETAENPNLLVHEPRTVSAKDHVHVKLESGGGWVMKAKPANP